MTIFIKLFLIACASTACFAVPSALPSDLAIEEGIELVINNRILAKVHGETISVLDVMKKMDFFLNRYYPELAPSKRARYQFYTSHWRETLDQMIIQELMVADAESREIKVSEGEVREEIQQRFGPNVMATLDKIGITYEEARKLVHQEMLVQRMQWLRVSSKALQKVNLVDVKEGYKQYCLQNPPKEEWKYQVLSIRSPEQALSEKIAERALKLLEEKQTDLATIKEQLEREVTLQYAAHVEEEKASLRLLAQAAKPLQPRLKGKKITKPPVTFTLSPDYAMESKSVSSLHKAILSSLTKNTFSRPLVQKDVVKLFHLKDHLKTDPPSFQEKAPQIKDELLQKAASAENLIYTTRLKNRFGYDEKSLDIPADFQPFSLR